jgi:hypothetical protein
MNGSRLGKEFSANVFNDLFNNPNKQINEVKHKIFNNMSKLEEHTHQNISEEKTHHQISPDFSLGSVLFLLDMPQVGNDY